MKSDQTIIDQELAQFGWVESIATNSISNFKSPISDVVELTTDEKQNDFIDTFICHLIFYLVFCYSLILYIFIDLGFGLFLENKMFGLFNFHKRNAILSFIGNFSN